MTSACTNASRTALPRACRSESNNTLLKSRRSGGASVARRRRPRPWLRRSSLLRRRSRWIRRQNIHHPWKPPRKPQRLRKRSPPRLRPRALTKRASKRATRKQGRGRRSPLAPKRRRFKTKWTPWLQKSQKRRRWTLVTRRRMRRRNLRSRRDRRRRRSNNLWSRNPSKNLPRPPRLSSLMPLTTPRPRRFAPSSMQQLQRRSTPGRRRKRRTRNS